MKICTAEYNTGVHSTVYSHNRFKLIGKHLYSGVQYRSHKLYTTQVYMVNLVLSELDLVRQTHTVT